ncbi:MAG: hypothetical protein JRI80_01205 [Deltaproteobacteria bacterium]|nr:hypothetical protein [Deltaproteobacteria bacterium]
MNILFLFSSPDGDIFLTPKDLEKPLFLFPSMQHPFLKLGDYFNAAQAFLLEHNLESFLNTLQPREEKRSPEERIRKLLIRSEKQGALYHVASVEIEGKSVSAKFSLVAAMTEKSREALEREYNTLTFLNKMHPSCGLPNAYCKGNQDIVHGRQTESLSFLLEEWLEGYHEWHVSRDGTGKQCLRVWDQEKGYYTASEKLFFQLFRQAARILTLLYDPETSRQVRPWHHAAGDFVIGNLADAPTARLTTARGYEPLLRLPGQGPKKILGNLLFFFLDMGLRMRLDRLDGEGQVTWIEGNILPAVTEGFFSAIETMTDEGYFTETVARDFLALLTSFSPAELIAAFEPLVEIYREGDPEELGLIIEHLPGHVEELSSITEKFPLSNRVSWSQ